MPRKRFDELDTLAAGSVAPTLDLLSILDVSVPQQKSITPDALGKAVGLSVCQALYAADGGSTDAYAVTLAPAPTAYAAGMLVVFKANTVNTGAATLNVNSLGAKTIKKAATSDLSNGDIAAGQIVMVVYDGTYFQLIR